MQAEWFSQKGNKRRQNSDAACIGQRGHHVMAVLVDGAEKGPKGAELARHWADTAWQALAGWPPCSPARLNKRLQQAQARLRYAFLHDIASYCMIRLDWKTRTVEIWHCGDCCVGVRQQGHSQRLTRPHTLAQQPGISHPCASEQQSRHHQQLTRSLNARRFRPPDYQTHTLMPDQLLLLGTDGYWQEHLEAGRPIDELHDDASWLTLLMAGEGLGRISQRSDADNLNDCHPGPAPAGMNKSTKEQP